MAEKEAELKDPNHVSICRAENGWKISCNYEPKQTMSQRAGWVPSAPYECKDFVEKTKDAVLKRLKEVL